VPQSPEPGLQGPDPARRFLEKSFAFKSADQIVCARSGADSFVGTEVAYYLRARSAPATRSRSASGTPPATQRVPNRCRAPTTHTWQNRRRPGGGLEASAADTKVGSLLSAADPPPHAPRRQLPVKRARPGEPPGRARGTSAPTSLSALRRRRHIGRHRANRSPRSGEGRSRPRLGPAQEIRAGRRCSRTNR